ncbi:hypothetical protein AB0D42_27745 [Streptomyces sp. NPDC048304]|uniref:hypothetical protein n=1 Tax=Streptomyces sp. NPDC048304 TaxID=3154820 RepID=UPI0033F99141
MSLTLTRTNRTARKHRAIDRLALREQELAELQRRLNDADALIERQAIRLCELESDKTELAGRLQQTQDALINIGKDRDALERYVRDLENQLADAERRLDVRTWAEAAAAKTVEMPIVEVVPLHAAPFATTNPGRVRPAWAKDEEAVS